MRWPCGVRPCLFAVRPYSRSVVCWYQAQNDIRIVSDSEGQGRTFFEGRVNTAAAMPRGSLPRGGLTTQTQTHELPPSTPRSAIFSRRPGNNACPPEQPSGKIALVFGAREASKVLPTCEPRVPRCEGYLLKRGLRAEQWKTDTELRHVSSLELRVADKRLPRYDTARIIRCIDSANPLMLGYMSRYDCWRCLCVYDANV